MAELDRGGVRISYQRFDSASPIGTAGNGVPLLLTHGFGASARMWDPNVAALAAVGGLSLGGQLSLAFWLAWPERVAALLLFDTGPGFRSDASRQRWNERALATAGRLDRDGLAGLGDGPRTPDAAGWRPHGLARAARGMLTQRDGRVMESLPSVDVPVLVLVGAEDKPFPAATVYVAAKIT